MTPRASEVPLRSFIHKLGSTKKLPGVIPWSRGYNLYRNTDFADVVLEIDIWSDAGLDWAEVSAINEQLECQFGVGRK